MLLSLLPCVVSTVVITATVVDGWDRIVEKHNLNHNSRSQQAVLDPSGYLRHGLQFDHDPALRSPSPEPSSASSLASVSAPPATDSDAGRAKTRTLRRVDQSMAGREAAAGTSANASEDTPTPSTNKDAARASRTRSSTSVVLSSLSNNKKKSRRKKMSRRRSPRSALQSMTDVPRMAAGAAQSLVRARPSASLSEAQRRINKAMASALRSLTPSKSAGSHELLRLRRSTGGEHEHTTDSYSSIRSTSDDGRPQVVSTMLLGRGKDPGDGGGGGSEGGGGSGHRSGSGYVRPVTVITPPTTAPPTIPPPATTPPLLLQAKHPDDTVAEDCQRQARHLSAWSSSGGGVANVFVTACQDACIAREEHCYGLQP
eukprot:CAMPEP_0179005906 /NCGR_PEP_ID=MMETSP0795-20121207/14230_1 /TAXON_ID=88552 /ORGANISM="Amoebophrya sp., Strain Ameob2" /LENGTH=370 /DNA_ID=CAMNT_0020700551 /DNA_START=117 /DNA_END=1226 /DNA_ORIENTATION=+